LDYNTNIDNHMNSVDQQELHPSVDQDFR